MKRNIISFSSFSQSHRFIIIMHFLHLYSLTTLFHHHDLSLQRGLTHSYSLWVVWRGWVRCSIRPEMLRERKRIDNFNMGVRYFYHIPVVFNHLLPSHCGAQHSIAQHSIALNCYDQCMHDIVLFKAPCMLTCICLSSWCTRKWKW